MQIQQFTLVVRTEIRYGPIVKKQWQSTSPDPKIIATLSESLNLSRIAATVLANRHISSADDARRFLNPSLNHIRPPFEIRDMNIAVDRIARAVLHRENILIFGDYDADGVTATVILYDFLRRAGAAVSYHIPHRIDEGYSLNPEYIDSRAIPGKIDLIITVDCGSTSHDALRAARRAGIDVVVSDHHNISEPLPPATAVINPKRSDCNAGFEHLSGAGVAFCLLICLRRHLRKLNYWDAHSEPNLKAFCDLVAIGTVADLVPLVAENRIFTRTGLEVIASGSRTGIKALSDASRIDGNHADADDIAYRLAPRINAAGRLAHADMAVELLMTTDPASAAKMAATLDGINTRRQATELKICDEILRQLETTPRLLDNMSLVMAHTGWHEGVIGIVASRLAQKYFRPVVLISIRAGIGKGSARSIPGFDLYQGLSRCKNDLDAFGGHRMAAGLSIRADRIDGFREHFEMTVRQMCTGKVLTPAIDIDADIDLDDINDRLIDELEAFKPFGNGNPEPLFQADNIRVIHSKIVGRTHRQMVLERYDGTARSRFKAIHFNIDPATAPLEKFAKMAFHLRWNRWNGNRTPQLVIVDTDPG